MLMLLSHSPNLHLIVITLSACLGLPPHALTPVYLFKIVLTIWYAMFFYVQITWSFHLKTSIDVLPSNV